MNLNYTDFGSGKPLVLIHAFPLSSSMWRPQLEAFSPDDFRLLLPDLPGFGDSPLAPGLNSIERMAEAVGHLLDRLSIPRAIIGGLSLGGYVALSLYRQRPEKFAALVLCDTTARADTEEKRQARRKLIEKIETSGSGVLVDEMLPAMLSDAAPEKRPELVESLRAAIAAAPPAGAINALRAMAERADSTDLLEKVSIPTALIFGEEDRITGLDAARAMKDEIAGAELFRISGAGHLSNLEQPQRFNRALTEFCSAVTVR